MSALKKILEGYLAQFPYAERIARDPIELPRRYRDARDIEVAALLSASLAYGRVDQFKPKVEALLSAMGSSPSRFVRKLDVALAAKLLSGFVYRFNVATDVAALLFGMGWALRERGSLEQLFGDELRSRGTLHGALDGFTGALRRAAPMARLRAALGPERRLSHLLPSPLGKGAAKRLNLFLRWMVRGPDQVDLGIWRRVPPSRLLVPLDTHLGRVARNLGLTQRKDLSWRTAEEITDSLRLVDPEDPVRFDFALCHLGMSGACPLHPAREHCQRCRFRPVCRRHG